MPEPENIRLRVPRKAGNLLCLARDFLQTETLEQAEGYEQLLINELEILVMQHKITLTQNLIGALCKV